jgi:hypothetical protein
VRGKEDEGTLTQCGFFHPTSDIHTVFLVVNIKTLKEGESYCVFKDFVHGSFPLLSEQTVRPFPTKAMPTQGYRSDDSAALIREHSDKAHEV